MTYIDVMSISFDKEDNRKKYLTDKLDDLVSHIDGVYGKALSDELSTRLKETIDDFNSEVVGMTDQLRTSTEKRSQLIEKIKSSIHESEKEMELMQTQETKPDPRELTEWEKRLESLESQG